MTRASSQRAAVSFLAGHGRVLDRRRLDLLLGGGDADAVLAALDAYRNPDGGYGWGIEPDLRSPESQPTGAMHAFEVLAEAGGGGPRAVELCDWLDRHSLPDGGLPFTLPVSDPAGVSPIWLGGDHETSSLQMTAQVAANAHRVAEVAGHPWLARATRWCFDAIERLDSAPPAYALMFAIRFLDAAPEGSVVLERLGALLPPDGLVPVTGGAPGETLRPLDFAPLPGPARGLFAPEMIAAELERLAGRQQPDGGWTVDFEASSPAAAVEWRGYFTVAAIATLYSPSQ